MTTMNCEFARGSLGFHSKFCCATIAAAPRARQLKVSRVNACAGRTIHDQYPLAPVGQQATNFRDHASFEAAGREEQTLLTTPQI